MVCRDCGLQLPVERTIDSSALTVRVHRCACGSRWESTQKITRRLPSITATGSTQVAGRQQANSEKIATGSNPVAGKGFGVSVSDPNSPLFPASSGPSEQSGSVSEGDQGVDPARERPAYPAAFEAFWSASWKEGSKGAALKAWKKARCPNLTDASPAMSAYLKAKATSGQAIAHVSSWLSAGGHLQTEWKLSPLPDRNAQPALRQAAPAPYHAPAKSVTADWSKVAPWPKEAKS